MKRVRPLALIALLIPMLYGCPPAVVTTFQVAGMAKTAYDYSEYAYPKQRVDFQGSYRSLSLEQRIGERLAENTTGYVSVIPHAVGSHVYLVGVFRTRTDAERARAVAKSVRGVRTLTCSFFLLDPARYDPPTHERTRHAIEERLLTDEELRHADVRVIVRQKSAVIMGLVGSPREKQLVEMHARKVKGVSEIRSYLAVVPQQVASR